jgi:hypothetical protein
MSDSDKLLEALRQVTNTIRAKENKEERITNSEFAFMLNFEMLDDLLSVPHDGTALPNAWVHGK